MSLKVNWVWIAAPLSGALLGLSAPGFDQWYLAWFLLMPFFLCVVAARSYSQSATMGYLFGLVYNFVSLSWLLKLSPPWWLGVQSMSHVAAAAGLAWLTVCLMEGLVTLVLACVCRLLILKTPRLFAPVLLIALPAVWVFLTHYVFINADLLWLSFSHIEYSQYRQLPAIQIAAAIGGVGVEALIVLFNLALAVFVATFWGDETVRALACRSRRLAVVQLVCALAIPAACLIWGTGEMQNQGSSSSLLRPDKVITASVVQLNLAEKYERTGRKPDANEIWSLCKAAADRCPPGLVVFSESILPEYVLLTTDLRDQIQRYARSTKHDLIMGVWEKTAAGQTYNSVISFPANERFRSEIYRKRYLMPVGEFEPFIMRFLGEPGRKVLHFSLMPDIQRGTQATVLPIQTGSVGILVCAENSQPTLCSESVTGETDLLVNLGTLTWFQGSHLGDLSKAAAVFRAIENRRSLIYASDTGPSFVIDYKGNTLAAADWNQQAILQAATPLSYDLTPFNGFCRTISGIGR